MRSHAAHEDVVVLADAVEIPGIGHLPVNAFVLRAEQPVLVDTGMPGSSDEFVALLADALDLDDLRWIYLTHPDRDHTGSLMTLLAAAPKARLVTTFLGMGILSIEYEIAPDRVFLLNPDQSLDVGDRTITAFRPPLFDSPATTGFLDDRTGTCFTSDCFGAPMTSAELATADDADDVPADDLTSAQQLWATVDSPWVHGVDRPAYERTVRACPASRSPLVLSTHLPPARNRSESLIDLVAAAPSLPTFVGPDQAALDALLAGFAPEPRVSPEREHAHT